MDWLKFDYDVKHNVLHISNKYRSVSFPGSLKRSALAVAVDTVHKIAETYPGPYVLMCSGGVDSQAMAYAWKLSEVQHKIVLFRYLDDNRALYNYHDLDKFVEFANKQDILFEYRDFNYFKFLNNDLKPYAERYDCASPQITAYMKMIEFFQDSTVILSGNFWPKWPKNPSLSYDILGLHRFSLVNEQLRIIPFFFSHTRELAFAFSEENKNKFENQYLLKCSQYLDENFPIIPQEEKLSGFEIIKNYFDDKTDLIKDISLLKRSVLVSNRIFDMEYRYKLREHLGSQYELTYSVV